MQFGLCNASATFQRFVDEVTRDLDGVYSFIDDILIASKSPQEHMLHLRALFERLCYDGLTINHSKCKFGESSLEFLGYQISENGLQPLPDRVEAIQKFPMPKNLTQLRSCLGMYNFYRRFIPRAAHILAPLNKFLEGHQNKRKSPHPSKKTENTLQWTEETEKAFTLAKQALVDATLLKYPIPGAQLSLWTDASDLAIGSSLMQLSGDKWEPIAFLSMKLSKSQRNWSTYDRELYAIYASIKKFRHMLEGRNFSIYTDHKPLIFAFKQKPEKCSPRQLRHLDYISQFSTDIRHVNGKDNIIADTLSRIEIDAITAPPNLDYKKIAQEQLNDSELEQLLESNSSL
ncbi:Retrovirus-related Pol polyprotein from transposon 17.6, partial [Araneus ventricosus]